MGIYPSWEIPHLLSIVVPTFEAGKQASSSFPSAMSTASPRQTGKPDAQFNHLRWLGQKGAENFLLNEVSPLENQEVLHANLDFWPLLNDEKPWQHQAHIPGRQQFWSRVLLF